MALAIFMGQGWSALDGKGRFSLPAAFRRPLQDQCTPNSANMLVSALDDQPYLTLFGDLQAPEFQSKFEEKERIALTRGQAFDEASCYRNFWSGTQSVSIDAGGRFALPAFHAQYAGITDSMFIIGAGPQIELWDLDALHAFGPKNPIARAALEQALRERDAKRGGKA